MTTLQQYNYNFDYSKFLASERRPLEDKLRTEGIMDEESARYEEIRNEQEKLEKYFDSVHTVSVQAWIGSRKYYKTVAKFGKYFYNRGDKMTQSNGWYSVQEIDEITDKMTEEMISDSYYY